MMIMSVHQLQHHYYVLDDVALFTIFVFIFTVALNCF